MAVVRHKAAIHSGHFMVSDFEPDEQDEEDAQVDTPTRGPGRATRESSVGVGLSTLIATTEEAESETLTCLGPYTGLYIKTINYKQISHTKLIKRKFPKIFAIVHQTLGI